MHPSTRPNIGLVASYGRIMIITIIFDRDIESNNNMFHDGSFEKFVSGSHAENGVAFNRNTNVSNDELFACSCKLSILINEGLRPFRYIILLIEGGICLIRHIIL